MNVDSAPVSSRRSRPLAVGERAPDFELSAGDGSRVRLSSILGQHKAIVVFFYPKDETPGCTAEACEFRDRYQDFADAGALVLGVSDDDAASHQRFAGKHRLPMPLLSDLGGTVRGAFGVKATFGLLKGRVTFVIDGTGVVRHVFESQLRATKHVEEALVVVRQLAAGG